MTTKKTKKEETAPVDTETTTENTPTEPEITTQEEASSEEITLNKDGFVPGQILSFDDIMKAKRKQADRIKSDKE